MPLRSCQARRLRRRGIAAATGVDRITRALKRRALSVWPAEARLRVLARV